MPAPLWLRPYHILSTGPRSGLIEMVTDSKSIPLPFPNPSPNPYSTPYPNQVTDTKSIDQLKRRRGYTSNPNPSPSPSPSPYPYPYP